MAKKLGKKKTSRMGLKVDLDLAEAQPEAGDPPGLLRNFVLASGLPKWGNAPFEKNNGTASTGYEVLSELRKVDKFTPNEPGEHAAVLVFIEKAADNVWRFHQVVCEDIQVLQ